MIDRKKKIESLLRNYNWACQLDDSDNKPNDIKKYYTKVARASLYMEASVLLPDVKDKLWDMSIKEIYQELERQI